MGVGLIGVVPLVPCGLPLVPCVAPLLCWMCSGRCQMIGFVAAYCVSGRTCLAAKASAASREAVCGSAGALGCATGVSVGSVGISPSWGWRRNGGDTRAGGTVKRLGVARSESHRQSLQLQWQQDNLQPPFCRTVDRRLIGAGWGKGLATLALLLLPHAAHEGRQKGHRLLLCVRRTKILCGMQLFRQ